MNRPRVGIVYAPGLAATLLEVDDAFDVLEIEPQTLSPSLAGDPGAAPWSLSDLEAIGEFAHPKVVHSVGMPFGNAEWPTPAEYAALRFVAEAVESPWVSDHLSFNRHAGRFAGFLLPLPQTRTSASAAAKRIVRLQHEVNRPVLFETGANYLRPRPGEMSDGTFFGTVSREADCGILLDLHNVWSNERNGRQSVADLIEEIPAERVVEMHVAGGHERSGYWLDAHSDLPPDALLDLAERVLPRLPCLQQITFEISPDYLPVRDISSRDLAVQLLELRALAETVDGRDRSPAPATSMPRPRGDTSRLDEEEAWKGSLLSVVNGRHTRSTVAKALKIDPAVELYRELIRTGRSGQLAGALPLTVRLLIMLRGVDSLEGMIGEYQSRSWPHPRPLDEARGFRAFLRRSRLDNMGVVFEVLDFELALLEVGADGRPRTAQFSVEPLELLGELGAGRRPSLSPSSQRFELVIDAPRQAADVAPAADRS